MTYFEGHKYWFGQHFANSKTLQFDVEGPTVIIPAAYQPIKIRSTLLGLLEGELLFLLWREDGLLEWYHAVQMKVLQLI